MHLFALGCRKYMNHLDPLESQLDWNYLSGKQKFISDLIIKLDDKIRWTHVFTGYHDHLPSPRTPQLIMTYLTADTSTSGKRQVIAPYEFLFTIPANSYPRMPTKRMKSSLRALHPVNFCSPNRGEIRGCQLRTRTDICIVLSYDVTEGYIVFGQPSWRGSLGSVTR